MARRPRPKRRRSRPNDAATAEVARAAHLLAELEIHQVELERQNAELRGARQRLVESEARYTDLYDYAPVVYLSLDRAGRILQINLTGAKMFGRNKERLVGKPFVAIARPDDTEAFFAHVRACFEGSSRVTTDLTIARADGERSVVQMTSEPFRGRNGLEAFCVLVDVTGRRRSEAELRAAHGDAAAHERRALVLSDVSALLARAPSGRLNLTTVARMIGNRLQCNCIVETVARGPDAPRLIGVGFAQPRDEGRALRILGDASFVRLLEGREPTLREQVAPDDLARITSEPDDLRVLRTLRIESLVVAPILVANEHAGAITLLSSDARRPFGASDVDTAEDLGRRIGLGLERAQMYQRLQWALTSRDQMLRVVSHDLLNTLGAIAMQARLLTMETLTPDARGRHVANIESGTDLASRLVSDLVDVANIEAGTFSISPVAQDAAALVASVASTFEAPAAAKRIALTVSSARAGRVVCDRNRVLQVLANLVGNAIKFTPPGGSIALEAVRDGKWVRFSVRDDGRGIPAGAHARVFDRDWRGDRGDGAGSGLGLFIAKSIVDAHGGSITVESSVGRGATFHFELPSAD